MVSKKVESLGRTRFLTPDSFMATLVWFVAPLTVFTAEALFVQMLADGHHLKANSCYCTVALDTNRGALDTTCIALDTIPVKLLVYWWCHNLGELV